MPKSIYISGTNSSNSWRRFILSSSCSIAGNHHSLHVTWTCVNMTNTWQWIIGNMIQMHRQSVPNLILKHQFFIKHICLPFTHYNIYFVIPLDSSVSSKTIILFSETLLFFSFHGSRICFKKCNNKFPKLKFQRNVPNQLTNSLSLTILYSFFLFWISN